MKKIRLSYLFFTLSLVFLILVFFGTLTVLIYFFAQYLWFWIAFLGIHYLICVIFIIVSIFSGWHSQYSLTIIITIVLLPYLGLYAFFIVERPRNLTKKLKRWEINYASFQNQLAQLRKKQAAFPPVVQNFAKFSKHFALFPFSNQTAIKLFLHPIMKIKRLHADLKRAKHYIYFNFYIFSDGQYLEILKRLLIQKLNQGVEVRIIYDAFGTATHSTLSFSLPLKQHGAIVKSFGTISPFLPNILDRNHRKDVVIDGKIAYTGGSNIGDEYLNLSSKFGYFADLDVRLEGSAASDLELIFWKDWLLCTGESLFERPLQPFLNRLKSNLMQTKPINSQTWMQVTDDGPSQIQPVNRDIFFNLFVRAKKRIWFTTPYFFIDNELNKALVNAALNGVDVRIILHDFSEFKFLVNLSRLHYDELLKAGVKIYEFSQAYLHSKLILIDDNFISIGTTNIDFTSFYYCYQTTLLIFDPLLNNHLQKTFLADVFTNSHLITQNPLVNTHRLYRWFLKFVQIFTVFL